MCRNRFRDRLADLFEDQAWSVARMRYLLGVLVVFLAFWAGRFSYPTEHWPTIEVEQFSLPYAPTYLFGTREPNTPAISLYDDGTVEFGKGWRVENVAADERTHIIHGTCPSEHAMVCATGCANKEKLHD